MTSKPVITKDVALDRPVLAEAEVHSDGEPMEEAVFQRFYRTTSRPLWSYLCRVTGDPSRADDLLQESYCKFLVAPVSALPEEEQRAYLFRIAGNLAIDSWRKHKRERETLAALAAAPAPAGGGPSIPRMDVERTFNELKPKERALLWLAYVEGSAHEEIAVSLGLRPKSVRVLLFRARQRLGALLKRKGLTAETTR